MAIGLPPQFEDGLADPQRGADLDAVGAGEALASDEGAVGRAEVLDEPASPSAVDRSGVPAAGEVVVEDEGALGVAADERAGAAQREARCR